MPDNNDTPAPTRRRSKTAIDLAFGLPQALAQAALESLTPAQKSAITPSDAGAIYSQCVECAETIANIVAGAEKEKANGEA